MALSVGSILEYSHIPPITQKSKRVIYHAATFLRFLSHLLLFRVLIVTIRDLGTCPCPTCLVKKSDIVKLGTLADIRTREALARVDDDARQRRVSVARRYIYGSAHMPVDGTHVETLLKPRSEVPTTVCIKYEYLLCTITNVWLYIRTPFLNGWALWNSIIIACLQMIYFTSGNSASSRRCSFTSYEFCMQKVSIELKPSMNGESF